MFKIQFYAIHLHFSQDTSFGPSARPSSDLHNFQNFTKYHIQRHIFMWARDIIPSQKPHKT